MHDDMEFKVLCVRQVGLLDKPNLERGYPDMETLLCTISVPMSGPSSCSDMVAQDMPRLLACVMATATTLVGYTQAAYVTRRFASDDPLPLAFACCHRSRSLAANVRVVRIPPPEGFAYPDTVPQHTWVRCAIAECPMTVGDCVRVLEGVCRDGMLFVFDGTASVNLHPRALVGWAPKEQARQGGARG